MGPQVFSRGIRAPRAARHQAHAGCTRVQTAADAVSTARAASAMEVRCLCHGGSAGTVAWLDMCVAVCVGKQASLRSGLLLLVAEGARDQRCAASALGVPGHALRAAGGGRHCSDCSLLYRLYAQSCPDIRCKCHNTSWLSDGWAGCDDCETRETVHKLGTAHEHGTYVESGSEAVYSTRTDASEPASSNALAL